MENETVIQRQLKYEFFDTLFSMLIGWAINSAMIIVAAVVFFVPGIEVTDLTQAVTMLRPILGNTAAVLFALALLFSGISSTTTAGMAGGSIFAGIFHEPYDIKDLHSRLGIICTYGTALLCLFFIQDPFRGLIYSQMLLSLQLPFTIGLQFYLTSSPKIMGKYANNQRQKIVLAVIGIFVTLLNICLLYDLFLN